MRLPCVVLRGIIWLAGATLLCPAAPAADDVQIPALRTLEGFSDWVTSAAWSVDGKLIATGTYDRVVLWDASSYERVRELNHKLGRVRAIAFTPDGNQMLAAGYQTITIWDHVSGKLLRELKGHRGYVTAVALLPEGRSAVSSSEDGTVRVWNLSSGESKVLLTDDDPMMSVACSLHGNLVATAAGDETRPIRPGPVKLWKADSGELVRPFESHGRAATCVTFSPDGKLLASAGFDEKVRLHQVEDGRELLEYAEHNRPVNRVQFLPDGKHAVSVAGGRAVGRNEIHVWDSSTGETIAVIEKHEAPVFDVAISPDGRAMTTTSRDQTAVVWDLSGLSKSPLTAALAAAQKDAQAASREPQPASDGETKVMRVGMIGLDTSHCIAFTEILNNKKSTGHVPGFRVTVVYPKGSPDIESSVSRVPDYTEKITKLGVEVVDSIDELVQQVDAVLLETNDGRPHLEQVIPVLRAGKPVFIDKPIAGSLTDAVSIFELGRHYKTPLFSSSSLRYSVGAQALRAGKIGEIYGCDTYSPCSLEKTHPDLFWYGIHGVEMLFTVMGTGCESVTRVATPDFDLVAGSWQRGRIGTFRGLRKGGGYGGTAFGAKGIEPVGKYDGYRPLVVEITKFFQTKEVPVTEQETLEIYAFMEAADESKRQGGAPVQLATVLEKAKAEAAKKVASVIARPAR